MSNVKDVHIKKTKFMFTPMLLAVALPPCMITVIYSFLFLLLYRIYLLIIIIERRPVVLCTPRCYE